ncbi:magnesium/cobalt transporter CorA [Phytoactinopolyspora halotolerans]|uniref:Magnesium transport protein CorA n=1 Tax=Phytoactinopolyspora halotolerans TaxID=1981512 RepID=A0A6L9S8F5_9ACTN|nr:magnesium/cobalt transporter CorA [Phytoactinopolyspora halotolerans]NEE00862.1 magnesium/cobalt transporter CorA [Phytoactinopolyspora halotolerans]
MTREPRFGGRHERHRSHIVDAAGGTAIAEHIVDIGIYRDGQRVASPASATEAARAVRDDREAMAWIGLYRPTDAQLLAAAEEFGLHELAIEDAIVAHQRPKLERYGDTLFAVVRSARYLDDTEEVDFGEIHAFVGPGFILTVRHSHAPDLSRVRRRVEADPKLLRLGPEAVLYAIFDSVVDEYAPVVEGLENDIDEIETQVFGGDPSASKRTYKLSREVVEFQRAARPLLGMLDALAAGFEKYGVDEELRRYLRDVADHATVVAEQVDSFRQALGEILTLNATLVNQAQNEQVKKISAWAAILFAPTLIGTVYGMNFDHMPELHWLFGYPFALALMLATCTTLYLVFKRRDWL